MGSGLAKKTLVLLFVFVGVIVILSFTFAPFGETLRGAFYSVAQYISRPFVLFGQWVANTWDNLSQLSSLSSELQTLKEENAYLRSEIAKLLEAQKENEELRALLNLKNSLFDWQTLSAQVISGDPSSFSRSLVIGCGSNEGIKERMPVLSPSGGLIGMVWEVYPEKSRVLLISDLNSFISGKIQRTGELGIIKGDGENGCFMEQLLKETTMQAGDVVVTSGEGGIYPPGLLVGKITEVYSRGSLHLRADIALQADITDLSFVLILIGRASE